MAKYYLDGCPCCPCCGSLIISGFGYEHTDPGPTIYPLPNNCMSTARWYNEDGTLAATSTLATLDTLSGLPGSIDTNNPPATITVTTKTNISTVLTCGIVKLPVGTQLVFRSTGGGNYVSDAVVVCNE